MELDHCFAPVETTVYANSLANVFHNENIDRRQFLTNMGLGRWLERLGWIFKVDDSGKLARAIPKLEILVS